MATAPVVYAGTPFGHAANGDPASLKRLTAADLARFHAAYWRPDNAVLVLTGDLSPAEGFALVGVSEPVGVPEPGARWAVGAHRFEGQSKPLPDQKMFTFAGYDVLRAGHDRA